MLRKSPEVSPFVQSLLREVLQNVAFFVLRVLVNAGLLVSKIVKTMHFSASRFSF